MELPQQQRRAASSDICQLLMQYEPLQSARQLLVYSALPDEVDLLNIVHWARERSITIGYPYIQKKTMEFRPLTSEHNPASLKGISAAQLPDIPLIPDGETIMLAPGRAFDKSGGRVGRAGGYYDRYIAAWRKRTAGLVIAVAFSQQMYAQVPVLAYDCRVDAICTETDLLICC